VEDLGSKNGTHEWCANRCSHAAVGRRRRQVAFTLSWCSSPTTDASAGGDG
jgi:hypothetical protein